MVTSALVIRPDGGRSSTVISSTVPTSRSAELYSASQRESSSTVNSNCRKANGFWGSPFSSGAASKGSGFEMCHGSAVPNDEEFSVDSVWPPLLDE